MTATLANTPITFGLELINADLLCHIGGGLVATDGTAMKDRLCRNGATDNNTGSQLPG